MSNITNLLAELSRNDDCQPCYNGVNVDETDIAYQRILDKLYNDAVGESLFATIDKDLLIKRLNEIKENQSCFYCPSEEVIKIRRDEERLNNSDSLKSENDYLEFMMRCIGLQRFYLSKFRAYFTDSIPQAERDSDEENLTATDKEKPKAKDDIIKGVKGLAEFLGCGVTKAQDILNKNILQDNGVAHRAGKGWRFNKSGLSEFVKKNPEAFRW